MNEFGSFSLWNFFFATYSNTEIKQMPFDRIATPHKSARLRPKLLTVDVPLTSGRLEATPLAKGLAPAFALMELWGIFVASLGPQEPFCMSAIEGEEMF